jgi:hypothetical protein
MVLKGGGGEWVQYGMIRMVGMRMGGGWMLTPMRVSDCGILFQRVKQLMGSVEGGWNGGSLRRGREWARVGLWRMAR